MRIHDGGDGTVASLGEGQDRVAVPGVAPGIDDDEPRGCVEYDRVSVRPAFGQDRAAQERNAGRNFLRGRRRDGRG